MVERATRSACDWVRTTPAASLSLTVFTDAANWSQTTVPAFPNTGDGSEGQDVYVPFSDFTVGGGTGANFADVGAVQLDMNGASAVDAQVGFIATIGPKTFVQNLANVTQTDLAIVKSAVPSPRGGRERVDLYAGGHEQRAIGCDWRDGDRYASCWGFICVSYKQPRNGELRQRRVDRQPRWPSHWRNGDHHGGRLGELRRDRNAHEYRCHRRQRARSEPGEQHSDGADARETPKWILAILKSAVPSPVVAGTQLTYTLTAMNNGPSDATGVTVTDTLPAGVSYVSASSSQGTANFANGELTVNLGGLATGGTATTTVVVSVNSGVTGTLTNTAVIDGNEPEANLANNKAIVETPIQVLVDLAITKVASQAEVKPGDQFAYTLTARNFGPSAADGVTVFDTLPSGLTLVSASSTQGIVQTYGSTVNVNVGSLPEGETATVTVLVAVTTDATGRLSNTATVRGTQPETDLSNNEAMASVQISPRVVQLGRPRLSKRLFLGR